MNPNMNFCSDSASLEKNRKRKTLLEQIAFEANILEEVPSCRDCHAKRFKHEPKGFCYSDGEISLVTNDIPQELDDLFISNSEQAVEFRKYIRTYNTNFAFTSFGVKYDKDLYRRNKGMDTFRVQGQVYHFINELIVGIFMCGLT